MNKRLSTRYHHFSRFLIPAVFLLITFSSVPCLHADVIQGKTNQILLSMRENMFFTPTEINHEAQGYFSTADSQVDEKTNAQEAILSSLLEQGIKLYKKRDYGSSVDYFSRALLLDKGNPLARTYLVDMALAQQLPSACRLQLLAYANLVQYNEKLIYTISYFIDKNSLLIERLSGKPEFNFFLTQEQGALEKIKTSSPPTTSFDEIEAQPGEKKALEAVNRLLAQDKDFMEQTASSLEDQYTRLREKYQNSTPKIVLNPNLSVQRKSFVESTPARGKATVAYVAGPQDDITSLKKELVQVRRRLTELERVVEQKNAELEGITNQLIDSSLKLTEREMLMAEKERRADSLKTGYDEIQSRFELVQKLIQEKDAEIERLREGTPSTRKKIDHDQKSLEDKLLYQKAELFQLSGMLEIYKQKYHDSHKDLKNKLVLIETMEDQLGFAHEQLYAKSKLLKETTENLTLLEQQIDNFLHKNPTPSDQPSERKSFKNELDALKKNVNVIKAQLDKELSSLQFEQSFLFFQ